MSVTGKVIRFDDLRGYGFIAPDIGGEDIFLHANDLDLDRSRIRAGARVSFEIEDGPRGKFATAVQFDGEPPEARSNDGGNSDEYYDVLSVSELKHSVTEALLDVSPALNGDQIQRVRAVFMSLARKYGWVE